MDDVTETIAALERELEALDPRIKALGDRLSDGETEVRRELNPAIARRLEIWRELYRLKSAAGLLRPEPQILYGPPSRFRRSSNRPDGDEDA